MANCHFAQNGKRMVTSSFNTPDRGGFAKLVTVAEREGNFVGLSYTGVIFTVENPLVPNWRATMLASRKCLFTMRFRPIRNSIATPNL